jgi:thaumarchaeosortase
LKKTFTSSLEEKQKFKTPHFIQQVAAKIHLKKMQTSLPIFFSFIVPITILFFLDPNSFQTTWKGRTFYFFFLWFIILELLLDWEKFRSKTFDILKPTKAVVLAVALLLPTVYVIVANSFGLNEAILNLAKDFNVPWADWVPLSIEYLVFTALFVVIIALAYEFDGVKDFSISAFFLGAIGTIYLIDNLYPYGKFTPFQIFVPTTAVLAANVLNLIGYQTRFYPSTADMPVLRAWNSQGGQTFSIAWPCSGVQSLFIYTFTILFFLKKTHIPWIQKIIYFAFGALVTYFVNILRIVSIYAIAINNGNEAALTFHNYYGELYAMTWIIAYPLIIIGSRMFWAKIKLRLGNKM